MSDSDTKEKKRPLDEKRIEDIRPVRLLDGKCGSASMKFVLNPNLATKRKRRRREGSGEIALLLGAAFHCSQALVKEVVNPKIESG